MVTLKDISKEAGVSINTVSCALRNSPRVSAEVKQRIKEIAERLGYMPNAAARTLRIKRSKVIGVVITDISNPFFGKMVKGVESIIKQKDYSIIICNTDEDSAMEEKAVMTMILNGVDGVIITPTQHNTSSLELLKKENIPFILMGRRFKDYTANYVISDDFRGGGIAGEYFLSKGYRSLIMINGPGHISSSQEREDGFVRALSKSGVAPAKIFYANPEMNDGYMIMQDLLKSSLNFTGVFCFDDYIAFGVIKAIYEKGYRVPDDIAVIGYDNTEFAAMLDMGLTSVDLNEYRTGEIAAELVIEAIENKNSKAEISKEVVVKQIILEPSLVVRGSA